MRSLPLGELLGNPDLAQQAASNTKDQFAKATSGMASLGFHTQPVSGLCDLG